MRTILSLAIMMSVCAVVFTPAICKAQNQSIYSNELDNGYQDWSWTTHSLTNTSPVFNGTYSISVAFSGYAGLFFHNSDESTIPYTALQFYIDGGASGGQQFDVAALGNTNTILGEVNIANYVPGGVVPANKWVQVTIPLSALNAAGISNFSGIWLQDTTGGNQPTLYVDAMCLLGTPVPTTVTATVKTTSEIGTFNTNLYGVNTAIWDTNMDDAAVQAYVKTTPLSIFRYPGGSDSDSFDWTTAQYSGMPMTKTFQSLVSVVNGVAYITANYGSGTPQMAAAWAAYCDAPTNSTVSIGVDSTGRNWYTAGYWAALRCAAPLATDDGLNGLRANHPASFGFTRFEIGNECYGSWENDTHVKQQDPVIYAQFFAAASALIKAIKPTDTVGAVVTGDEDSWGNQTETVTNPVTGVKHSGWTAVLFSTLNSLGVVPDFVIYHSYPESPGSESDYVLLHNSCNWSGVATSIRTMLTDYFAGAAASTHMVCTEVNSVTFNPGKQSTSLVEGLFYADAIGSMTQTEFQGLLWWNEHNSVETGDNNSAGLYGWRQYGDYGLLADGGSEPGAALDTPYPSAMTLVLMNQFSKSGDIILPTSSSYTDLSVYASKNSSGIVDLLVIDKNPTVSFTTTISLTGYTAAASTTQQWSYGIPQDTAQSLGQTAALATSSTSFTGNSLVQTFAPYSMTVIQVTP